MCGFSSQSISLPSSPQGKGILSLGSPSSHGNGERPQKWVFIICSVFRETVQRCRNTTRNTGKGFLAARNQDVHSRGGPKVCREASCFQSPVYVKHLGSHHTWGCAVFPEHQRVAGGLPGDSGAAGPRCPGSAFRSRVWHLLLGEIMCPAGICESGSFRSS